MEARLQPLVSVIMPCYCAETWLDQAIASVAAQSITDWELLILDDCSSDSSPQIAERWAKKDKRIRLIQNPRNCGVAWTRNRGLDLAAGTWIALLDSDDFWRPDKLRRQLELADRTGAELIYASYTMFRENPSRQTVYRVPSSVSYEDLLKENVIGCSTVLLKRAALGNRRFSLELYHEDYALWLELLRSGVQAAGCEEILANWRILPGSRSFRKWSAAKNRWQIYRKSEKLSIPRSIRCFASYAVRGLAKHKRL